MKFRKKTDSEVSVNLTPLIDVVFLLLIFFMVSTTFKKNTQLSVQLPQAATQITPLEKDVIKISIDNKGRYELNGHVYDLTDLSLLSKALASDYSSENPLLIMGDKAAPHQSLVSLLEVAADLNILKIRILAQFDKNEKTIN